MEDSMLQLLELGLSNAIAATVLCLIAAAAARVCSKPPLLYCLWLIVLLKLVTPPMFLVPLPAALTISPQELTKRAPRDAAPPVGSVQFSAETVLGTRNKTKLADETVDMKISGRFV